MLAAIRGATRSIDFESYIYWGGDIGKAFAEALSERAKPASRCTSCSTRSARRRWIRPGSPRWRGRRAGAQVPPGELVQPRPPQQPHPPQAARRRRLRRLHRRRRHRARMDRPRPGPRPLARHALPRRGPGRRARCRRSSSTTGSRSPAKCCTATTTFPRSSPRATLRAQMFSSSPTGGSESMALMYQLAIASASRTIDLSAAYFVPDELTVRAPWRRCARRKLRVIVPGDHIDSETSRSASRAQWGSCWRSAPRSSSTPRRCTTARCSSSTAS